MGDFMKLLMFCGRKHLNCSSDFPLYTSPKFSMAEKALFFILSRIVKHSLDINLTNLGPESYKISKTQSYKP